MSQDRQDHDRMKKSLVPNGKLERTLNEGQEMNFSLEKLNSNMWKTQAGLPFRRQKVKHEEQLEMMI